MRPYKVSAAPPFEGDPIWNAHFYQNGHWREVRNEVGDVMTFATAPAAMVEAKRWADCVKAVESVFYDAQPEQSTALRDAWPEE